MFTGSYKAIGLSPSVSFPLLSSSAKSSQMNPPTDKRPLSVQYPRQQRDDRLSELSSMSQSAPTQASRDPYSAQSILTDLRDQLQRMTALTGYWGGQRELSDSEYDRENRMFYRIPETANLTAKHGDIHPTSFSSAEKNMRTMQSDKSAHVR
jgi:hypothetical protein